MKLSVVSIALSIAGTYQSSAFVAPLAPLGHHVAAPASKGVLSASFGNNQESSRTDFLKQVANAGFAAASLAFLPASPANAAKYGGFGAGSPEVLDPKDAIVDRDILGSDAVQKSLSNLNGFVDSVKGLRSKLGSDPQAEVGRQIRKDFDFTQLRNDLNTLDTAFDEETQRGTDRLIRLVLQDITELEAASKLKDGVPRSERRLATMNGKLDKLQKAFEDYLAFAK